MLDIKSILRKNYKLRLLGTALIVITILTGISFRFYHSSPSLTLTNQSSNLSINNANFVTYLKDTSLSLVLFLMIVLFLVIIFEIIWRLSFDEIDKLEILPFDTNDAKELNGQAITDAIFANLQLIHDVLTRSKILFKNEPELLSIPSTGIEGTIRQFDLTKLEKESDRVAHSLQNAVKYSFGGWELFIIPLILAIFRLRKIGDDGCIICGSFHKYGESIFAQAQVRTKNGSFSCETEGSYNKLPDLIKDLAFEIAFKLSEIMGPKKEEEDTNKHSELDRCIEEIIGNCPKTYDPKIENKGRLICSPSFESFFRAAIITGIINYDLYKFISEANIPDEIKNLEKNAGILDECYGNRDNGCERKYTYFYDRKDDTRDFDSKKIEELNRLICGGINQQQERSWDSRIQDIMKRCGRRTDCFHLNRIQLEEICPKLKDRLPIKSPTGLKYFVEAADEFLKYKSTKNLLHLNKAKDKCKSAYDEEKNRIFIWMFHSLGLAYYDEKKFDMAQEMFAKAIDINPNAFSFTGKGFSQKYQNDLMNAIDEFENAINYDRDYDKPWNLLGAIYFNLGVYASDLDNISIACFNEAIKRDSNVPYPWMMLSLIYYRKSYVQEKIKCNSADNYNKIAMNCIRKSIILSKKYGHTEFFPVQLELRDSLESLIQQDESKRRKYHSYKLIKGDDYNRACQASLRNRKQEAEKYLEKALGNGASANFARFDPDLKYIDKLDEILEKYPDDIKKLEIIRDILENDTLINKNIYILASFKAVCNSCEDAVKLLRELEPDKLERFEEDPHFSSVYKLAIFIRPNEISISSGSRIAFALRIVKTCEARVYDIQAWIQLPTGLIFASNDKEDIVPGDPRILKLKPFPEGRWQEQAINQEIIIDENAMEKLHFKVKLEAKTEQRSKEFNDGSYRVLESGKNIKKFQIERKIEIP
jgi:tetratricopeptide (TPR) repeat protein